MKKDLGLTTLLAGALVCVVSAHASADELTLELADASISPMTDGHSESCIFAPKAENIWQAGPGEGFARGLQELRISAGPTIGLAHIFGHNNHNLALAMVEYGWMISDVRGAGHWYSGNWELYGEGVAGGQYHPKAAYVVGATVMLRYNFATGAQLVPFIDTGFGPSMQNIGLPDVSTTFEFNTQGGVGAHYFLWKHSAVTFEARFFHLSNAGLHEPNQSVNTLAFLTGWSWFY
jgi:hypothetical protein